MHFNQCSRETMPVHYLHQKRSSIDLKQKCFAVNVTMVGGRGPRLVVRTTAIFVTMICVASFYGRSQPPAYEEPKIVSRTSHNIAKVSTTKSLQRFCRCSEFLGDYSVLYSLSQ